MIMDSNNTNQKVFINLQDRDYSDIKFNIVDKYILFEDLAKGLYGKDILIVKACVTNVQTATILITALNQLQEELPKSDIKELCVFLKDFRIGDDTNSDLIQTLLKDIDSKCDSLVIYNRDITGVNKYSAARDFRKLLWNLIKDYQAKDIVVPWYQAGAKLTKELLELKMTKDLIKNFMFTHKEVQRFFIQEEKEKCQPLTPNSKSELGILFVDDLASYIGRLISDAGAQAELLKFEKTFEHLILVCARGSFHLLNEKRLVVPKLIEEILERSFEKIYVPDFEAEIIQELPYKLVPINLELFKTY